MRETLQRLQKTETYGAGGGGSHQRRMSAASQKLQLTDCYVAGLDSLTTASLLEVDQ